MTQEYLYPLRTCEEHSQLQPQDGVPEDLSTGKPVEVTFQFPKEPNSVIAKMMVSLDDKTIEAKVMEKVQAQQKYDDAVASGNMVSLLKESDNLDLH